MADHFAKLQLHSQTLIKLERSAIGTRMRDNGYKNKVKKSHKRKIIFSTSKIDILLHSVDYVSKELDFTTCK